MVTFLFFLFLPFSLAQQNFRFLFFSFSLAQQNFFSRLMYLAIHYVPIDVLKSQAPEVLFVEEPFEPHKSPGKANSQCMYNFLHNTHLHNTHIFYVSIVK